MAHIASIGAGLYSDLSIAAPTAALSVATLNNEAAFSALFKSEVASVGGVAGVGAFVRVKNVREFPPIGTPPNIVNVPTYGQAMSQQIQGQADAPNLEMTINLVSSEIAAGTLLGSMIGDGKLKAFRFALLNSKPTGYASDVAGLGTVENSIWYWVGKLEAITVTPNLTDANTATITATLQSNMFGAFTL